MLYFYAILFLPPTLFWIIQLRAKPRPHLGLHCWKCNYPLINLTNNLCPECGSSTTRIPPRFVSPAVRYRLLIATLLFTIAAALLLSFAILSSIYSLSTQRHQIWAIYSPPLANLAAMTAGIDATALARAQGSAQTRWPAILLATSLLLTAFFLSNLILTENL